MADVAQIVKPDLPGTSLSFRARSEQRPAPSFAEVVAVPLTHDWGPMGADIALKDLLRVDFSAFEALYGTSDTAGRTAVLGAFEGIGLASEGSGAGGVLPYRMGTSAAAAATVTINATGGGAAELRLDAIYKGTRGNDLSYAIAPDPVTVGSDRLQILYKGAPVESYSYVSTNVAALAAAINARPSRWVKATSLATGTALTATSGTALAGGNDGASVASGDWLGALGALEFGQFGIIAPYNLTDSAIQASLLAWLQTQAEEMRPVIGLVGGGSADDADSAIARSAALRDPRLINFGVGVYHDDLIGKDLSTAQLVPRLAGILAARGQQAALTRAPVGGLSVVGGSGPAASDLKALRDAGVTTLRRVSDPDVDLAVTQGVTTFNSTSDPNRSYKVFSEPRFVRIMDNFIRNMRLWGDRHIVGLKTVTEDTRAAVRQQANKLARQLEDDQLILPATFVIDVPDVSADPELSDAIPFTFGWAFAPTANFIIGEGRVR